MARRTPAGIPQTIDFAGYFDVLRIRSGTSSTLYSAREEISRRPVALKVLSAEEPTRQELEGFDREAAALAGLGSHPHVLTLYRSLALPDGRPMLVLELCRCSLAQRVRSTGAMRTQDAVVVVSKIASALETAHLAGVLHRDVRPGNILLTEFDEPVLGGFSLSRLTTSGASAAELFNYPGPHAAPELLLGEEPNAATDVYGLASTLYEMLSGAPAMLAFADEDPAATILRIVREPAKAIMTPGVPLALSDLTLWGMAKDPSARPPSVAWFAEELGRIQAHSGWAHTPQLVREPAELIALRARAANTGKSAASSVTPELGPYPAVAARMPTPSRPRPRAADARTRQPSRPSPRRPSPATPASGELSDVLPPPRPASIERGPARRPRPTPTGTGTVRPNPPVRPKPEPARNVQPPVLQPGR